MAASSSNPLCPADFDVPEGWVVTTKRNRKGQLVKCYTNIFGQTFFSEFDLMRNIRYSKEMGFNMYAPNFVPPTSGPFAMASKPNKETASPSNERGGGSTNACHQDDAHQGRHDEALTEDEVLCARALVEISGQSSSIERRASRRVAGLRPELQVEFESDRALEYVIKDKSQS